MAPVAPREVLFCKFVFLLIVGCNRHRGGWSGWIWGSKRKGRSVGQDYGSLIAFGAYNASNSTQDDSLGSAIRSMSICCSGKRKSPPCWRACFFLTVFSVAISGVILCQDRGGFLVIIYLPDCTIWCAIKLVTGQPLLGEDKTNTNGGVCMTQEDMESQIISLHRNHR